MIAIRKNLLSQYSTGGGKQAHSLNGRGRTGLRHLGKHTLARLIKGEGGHEAIVPAP